jgi:hypothetical protein
MRAHQGLASIIDRLKIFILITIIKTINDSVFFRKFELLIYREEFQ